MDRRLDRRFFFFFSFSPSSNLSAMDPSTAGLIILEIKREILKLKDWKLREKKRMKMEEKNYARRRRRSSVFGEKNINRKNPRKRKGWSKGWGFNKNLFKRKKILYYCFWLFIRGKKKCFVVVISNKKSKSRRRRRWVSKTVRGYEYDEVENDVMIGRRGHGAPTLPLFSS